MIEIKVFVDDLEAVKHAIYHIAAYRHHHNLFIWSLRTDDDAGYTITGHPSAYVVIAQLVTEEEAIRMLNQERQGKT